MKLTRSVNQSEVSWDETYIDQSRVVSILDIV